MNEPTRNAASDVLAPDNDPVVPHILLIEDLAKRTQAEAKAYEAAVTEERQRGIEPSLDVLKHRIGHEGAVGLALLEAAYLWLAGPTFATHFEEGLAKIDRNGAVTDQTEALLDLIQQGVEADRAMGREADEADAKQARTRLRCVGGRQAGSPPDGDDNGR